MKHRVYNKIFWLFLILFIFGCTANVKKENELIFNELVVKNSTHRDISNLEIRVEKINRVFSCGIILSKSFCSNKFSRRVYEGNSVKINWYEGGKEYVVGSLVVERPKSYIKNTNYQIVLVLRQAGQHMAYFVISEKR